MDIFYNGRFVSSEEGVVSAHDAGLMHGVGLFETMAAVGGRVIAEQLHYARLLHSARSLGLTVPYQPSEFALAVEQTLKRNGLSDARIRLTLTPGSLSLLAAARGQGPDQLPLPTVLIEATPPVQYAAEFFDRGVLATVAAGAVNSQDVTSGHKTLNYWGRLIRLREAGSAGAGEVIHLNESNYVTGGAVSNLFLVRDGVLVTPPTEADPEAAGRRTGVLPGVTRQVLIEQAQQEGLTVCVEPIDIGALLEADEIFLTNSSWHVLPVRQVERKVIGDGRPGEVTMTIRRRYDREILNAGAGVD